MKTDKNLIIKRMGEKLITYEQACAFYAQQIKLKDDIIWDYYTLNLEYMALVELLEAKISELTQCKPSVN